MMDQPFDPTGIRLGIVRGISYGLFGPPDEFMPQLRALGAGLVRLYVYWGQVEPEPGRYDWRVVDAFLGQLTGDEEVWVTVCSSSPWATRQATDFLPPSPARDNDVYYRFVQALVTHCAGRVQYWQCNNEPSNSGLLWTGTAAEYVDQLTMFHRAVRATDPRAAVVLGGCGYDVLGSAAGSPARQFFDQIVDQGRDAFDLFDVHLYDDPVLIPTHVTAVRQMMRAHGFERPVVVGEYNGPTLFAFPEVEAVLQQTLAAVFAQGETADFSTAELAAQAARETPERRAMKALYARLPDLPPQLQMFMASCPRDLEEKRHRINCRQIVMRNLLALSTGVTRTACWDLAPEVPRYADPLTMMDLLYGKLTLMDYAGADLRLRHPAAETFRLLTRLLAGAESVTRVEIDAQPELFAFEVRCQDRDPLLVLWKQGDTFSGETDAPTLTEWPWTAPGVDAVDVFGAPHPVEHRDGVVRLSVSSTPAFISSHRLN